MLSQGKQSETTRVYIDQPLNDIEWGSSGPSEVGVSVSPCCTTSANEKIGCTRRS